MDIGLIQQLTGDTDIYLLDQICKGRYALNERILDAGCGTGRNMHWFLKTDMCIYGIDNNRDCIQELKMEHPDLPPMRLQVAALTLLPFGDAFFDHIICSAVLHFASDADHFFEMFAEMCRVLKPGGSLFIRTASNIGIEDRVKDVKNGQYALPDGSTRFLLTRQLLHQLLHQFPVAFIEPFKTVNVNDLRSMSTLVLQKAARPAHNAKSKK